MQPPTEEFLTSFSRFQVTSADTDMYGRLRLGSLGNFLVQAAIQSADKLGFGYSGLQEHRLFWVLSRLTVQIHRPLKWYEQVEVETWPKAVEKILYLRDYVVRDEQQSIVAKATSGWLAIDLEQKRPKTVEGVHSQYFTHLKEKHAIEEPPQKVMPVKEGEPFNVQSTYFDLDLNKHVTATRYIDWMMDTFPLEFHEKHYPQRLSMNYLKETMPNEALRLLRKEAGEQQYSFEGTNTSAETKAFRGEIGFE